MQHGVLSAVVHNLHFRPSATALNSKPFAAFEALPPTSSSVRLLWPDISHATPKRRRARGESALCGSDGGAQRCAATRA